MKLNDGEINGTYRVIAIENLELPVERRLEAIGLTNGTNITILNKKKKGWTVGLVLIVLLSISSLFLLR